MKSTLRRVLLTIVVSCGLLGAIGLSTADASPDTGGLRGVGAALGAHVGSLEAAADAPSPVSLGGAEATSGTEQADARTTRPAPVPLGGPDAPTPFGLSLVGLVGIGVWMHRRGRRMRAPLI